MRSAPQPLTAAHQRRLRTSNAIERVNQTQTPHPGRGTLSQRSLPAAPDHRPALRAERRGEHWQNSLQHELHCITPDLIATFTE